MFKQLKGNKWSWILKILKVLSPENYQKIIYDWNKMEAEYPQDKTAVDLFEEQADGGNAVNSERQTGS